MREKIRKLKIVITVFTVLIAICLLALVCVLIFGNNGPVIGSAVVYDNVINIPGGK